RERDLIDAAESAVLPYGVQPSAAAVDRDLRDAAFRADRPAGIRIERAALQAGRHNRRCLGPGRTFVRRPDDADALATLLIRILVDKEFIEDVDQVAVRQHDDLAADCAVELAAVVDIPSGLPGLSPIGCPREPDRLAERSRMDGALDTGQRVAGGRRESVPYSVGIVRVGGIRRDRLLVIEGVSDVAVARISDQAGRLAPGIAAVR